MPFPPSGTATDDQHEAGGRAEQGREIDQGVVSRRDQLRAQQPFDRDDRLGDLVVATICICGGGIDHAVVEVFIEETESDAAQRTGDRRDLGQDVDAVRALVDHAGEAADLSLDETEPFQVVVSVYDVAGHVRCPFLICVEFGELALSRQMARLQCSIGYPIGVGPFGST